MSYPEITYPKEKALELKDFRDMDYYTVNEYHLPIELMMENAGLQLANFISKLANKNQIIKIGVGNGNNGGGGLVAARRLAAWGYQVYIDQFVEITKDLPSIQLKRALKFGASLNNVLNPDVWVDAYLGFSQRLPLDKILTAKIKEANMNNAIKVSLDIPTGYLGDQSTIYFEANHIVSLAAPKKILFDLPKNVDLYVADLGIPDKVYQLFSTEILPFNKGNILKLKR